MATSIVAAVAWQSCCSEVLNPCFSVIHPPPQTHGSGGCLGGPPSLH